MSIEELNRKKVCIHCVGEGWTVEHSTGEYDHDEDGGCLNKCPVQVQCEHCRGTGYIEY